MYYYCMLNLFHDEFIPSHQIFVNIFLRVQYNLLYSPLKCCQWEIYWGKIWILPILFWGAILFNFRKRIQFVKHRTRFFPLLHIRDIKTILSRAINYLSKLKLWYLVIRKIKKFLCYIFFISSQYHLWTFKIWLTNKEGILGVTTVLKTKIKQMFAITRQIDRIWSICIYRVLGTPLVMWFYCISRIILSI